MKILDIIKAFGLSIAVSTGSISFGDEKEIVITSGTTDIPLEGNKPIDLTLTLIDGNITVDCYDETDVIRVVVNDFDPKDEDRNRASCYYDAEEGSIRFKLQSDLKESDVHLSVPCNASLKLSSIDGNIWVNSIGGNIDASTKDGDIRLRDISGPAVADAVDGDISISIEDTLDIQSISAGTIDGDITLSVLEGAMMDVVASALDGEFSCRMPFRAKQNDAGGTVSRNKGGAYRIQGAVNGGGQRVSLKSIDGDVTIRTLDTKEKGEN